MAIQPQPPIQRRRTTVYIDGFNLYFSLKEKGWGGFMWLDIVKFASGLLVPEQELVRVKYFTSRIKNDALKQARQNLYLDALGTLDQNVLKIYYGDYQSNDVECRNCGTIWRDDQEKQTDVNIATHMLVDSFSKDAAGRAIVEDLILVTADSDQCPAMKGVRALGKSVTIALPPGRYHYLEVQKTATSKIEIKAKKFIGKRLPDQITLSDGTILTCPAKWLNPA